MTDLWRGDEMANGGFNPAVNVQLATDTESRAIWEWKSVMSLPIRLG